MKKQDVRFGPAGIGGSKEAVQNLNYYKKAGIRAAEVEFTYGVKMHIDDAKRIGEEAKKLDIRLSVHAPYYINLVSEDMKIRESSKKRILEACERAHYFSKEKARIVFHAAYYGKYSKQECYPIVKKAIIEMNNIIKKKKWNVILAPETTGKATQFGDLDELLRLSKETGCFFCIDFAHMKARYNGKITYKEIFDKIKNIKDLHSHFSGIEFTAKGERRHLITPESWLSELLAWIKKYNLSITIINESPDPLGDSLKGSRIWNSMSK